MADSSNGMGNGASFMMPPAPGDGFFPQAPGEAPVLDTRNMLPAPPMEHQTPAPAPVPTTAEYEGGGIFASSTPGPAEEELAREEETGSRKSQGYDFGPSIAMDPAVMSPAPMPGPVVIQSSPPVAPLGPELTRSGLGQTVDRGTLGLSVIAVAGGAALGLYYGGGWGALAGSLFGGAAVGAYRAATHVKQGTPESDKEAIASGTAAVGAAAIGGVIWAKLVEARLTPNIPQQKKQHKDVLENPDTCDIRPVGP